MKQQQQLAGEKDAAAHDNDGCMVATKRRFLCHICSCHWRAVVAITLLMPLNENNQLFV